MRFTVHTTSRKCRSFAQAIYFCVLDASPLLSSSSQDQSHPVASTSPAKTTLQAKSLSSSKLTQMTILEEDETNHKTTAILDNKDLQSLKQNKDPDKGKDTNAAEEKDSDVKSNGIETADDLAATNSDSENMKDNKQMQVKVEVTNADGKVTTKTNEQQQDVSHNSKVKSSSTQEEEISQNSPIKSGES